LAIFISGSVKTQKVFPVKLIYILVRHRISDVLGSIRYTFGWIAIARIHFFNTGLEKERGLSPFGWTGKRVNDGLGWEIKS
jgi:hypothetical protein